MINTLADNYVEIEYLHKLNEDYGELKAGVLIRRTPTGERRPFYNHWNGEQIIEIPQEKVTLYQKTTRVTFEEVK
jgi:hypothetical protein